MGCFDALMSKPQGDGSDIDSGLEQIHGGSVPDDMRSDPFGAKARAIGAGTLDRLLKKVIEAVRRQNGSSDRGESQRIIGRFDLAEPALQDPCRLWPERDGSILASLGERGQLHLMPPRRVRPSGSRIRTIRYSDESTRS